MAGVLIVGYGNPLRGDDGLGWHAAQRLLDSLQREDVTILVRHQLTPELAEPLSQVDLAIFIDAGAEGTPGTLICQKVQPGDPSHTSFTHDFDIPALLVTAQLLYGKCPNAFLLTVAAEAFDYEERLSAVVEAAIPALVNKAHELLDQSE